MRLYEILKRELMDEGKKEDLLLDTGERYSSTVAFKQVARQAPEKYAGKVYELHPIGVVRIEPKTQTILTFGD